MQTAPSNFEFKPVRIKYRESAEFMMEAMEQLPQRWKFVLRWWYLIIGLILVLLLLKSIAVGDGNHLDWKGLVASYCPILVILSILIWFQWRRAPLSRRWYRNTYRKKTGREESQVICEFGDAAVFVSTEGGVASHYPWNSIQRVVERPAGLLVYTGPEVFHWFPKSAFDSESDYAAVLRLIHTKVGRFEQNLKQ